MTRPFYLHDEAINNFIEAALAEDVGEGDHSSLAAIPATQISKAKLLIKAEGIIAGLELAEKIFRFFDPKLGVVFNKKDGDPIKAGEVAFTVEGSARSILTTERLVLNCMQRMSGIATYTHRLCKLIEGTSARLMDTRKTTPNFRLPEKWAVLIGGGLNHRFALYDMVMLKDNHIDFAGGITKAIDKAKQYLKDTDRDLKIIVEARDLDEIRTILESDGVHRILIDNFNYEDTRTAVKLIGDKCLTESSGGINEETIRDYALCGVDYISSGALTHSVYNMDLSLKAV